MGPLHKNFTSVVGPNGSGKSNLIESLLFIFGKKANKMRLKQLHQLIHNSSDHQNIKKAYVEVHFQEIYDFYDSFEVVPNTDFTVRRTVYHTSVSKFEVNGTETTQNEVIQLLKQKGIDLDNNRFLILQGEVEQISLMPAKSDNDEKPGLLEYLEDIIGSNRYKIEILHLENNYESQINNKLEKGELLRISEQDLFKLDDQKNMAIKYVKQEKKLFQLNNLVHQIDRHRANKELIVIEQQVTAHQQRLKDVQKEQKDKLKENSVIIKEYQAQKDKLE